MRREPPLDSEPVPHAAPPVTCVACGSDAFALGPAQPTADEAAIDVDLRCGACGRWQRRRLTAAAADRFLDHMGTTQATIARALSGPR